MKTTIGIDDVCVDNIEKISESLLNGADFEMIIYKNDKKSIGVWIANSNSQIDATLMFEVSNENARFMAESIISMINTKKNEL